MQGEREGAEAGGQWTLTELVGTSGTQIRECLGKLRLPGEVSSIFNRVGMEECRVFHTALWALFMSCMGTAKITTSENTSSLFVFLIRHTRVCMYCFYKGQAVIC